ncbi:WbqC family protein [Aureibaculum sp. 2210JD6-5]|uniref:WbqC family protein n=1 Tax=Aureibaculum sp. 2210JD6-5 TaxID=3103957 RepID=UPI002AAF07B7|nr:WbqC family protein [Aureibaculum sp. 2210JD6-5]MDY7395547.1 WbqC family protein [Aureibaculum sp. 2210JD6-5]
MHFFIIILYPTYFSPIIHFIALAHTNEATFEVEDNYQKQTYRTRCYIYGANGKQLLNIPVLQGNSKQKTKDVLLDNSISWQRQHIKSMASAYKSSPFYEFYEDDLRALLLKKHKYLLDLNLDSQELMIDNLPMEITIHRTKDFQLNYHKSVDFRFLADAKSKKKYNLPKYYQVFSDKHGFIPNLSILDLLFMEGPNAINYLENQEVEWI